MQIHAWLWLWRVPAGVLPCRVLRMPKRMKTSETVTMMEMMIRMMMIHVIPM